jgi:hypothetical protein
MGWDGWGMTGCVGFELRKEEMRVIKKEMIHELVIFFERGYKYICDAWG